MAENTKIFLLTNILIVGGGILLWQHFFVPKTDVSLPNAVIPTTPALVTPTPQLPVTDKPAFLAPLDRASERTTKKAFGTFVTPQNSPVTPERFQGYHTGVDFEIFPEEAETAVEVNTVCAGKLIDKRRVSGYGGVAVMSCEAESSPITVVYGHLQLSSITPNVGDVLEAGVPLGILGQGYSRETDGERKHLHLGFHRERAINLRGYVGQKNALSDWMDPCLFVCQPR